MKVQPEKLACLVAALCLALVVPLSAQGRRPGQNPFGGGKNPFGGGKNPFGGQNPPGGGRQPQGGRPSRGRTGDYYNLGPTGIQCSYPGGTTLRIANIVPGSPAEKAGVRVGTTITGVAGKDFVKDGWLESGRAIEKAEDTGRDVVFKTSAGELRVPTQKLGRYASSNPKNCKRTTKVLRKMLSYIAKNQGRGGSFPTSLGGNNGLVCVTSICGLALMTDGSGPGKGTFGSQISKAVDFVIKNVGVDGLGGRSRRPSRGGANWNQTNWGLGYGGMFLAEAYNKSKNPRIKAKLKWIAKKIADNQEQSGGWAHGPGGPNALNYLELEIVSNYVLAALGMAKKVGVDYERSALTKGVAYVDKCTTPGGATAYSPRRGQYPGTAEPGRTSGALFALAQLKKRGDMRAKMGSYIQSRIERIPYGHGSPSMHMLAGALASNIVGGSLWRTYWKTYRVQVMLSRGFDGRCYSRPTSESQKIGNTDDKVGPLWITAHMALILGIGSGKVPLLGGGRGSKGGSNDAPGPEITGGEGDDAPPREKKPENPWAAYGRAKRGDK